MKRSLRQALVVLWAAFGCVGIGAIAGWWWLDDALDRSRGAAPTVRIVEATSSETNGACVLPETMDRFIQMFREERGGDLPSFVTRLLRCAESDTQRLAFAAMLEWAHSDGDTIASRALEVVAEAHCAALSVVTGTAAAHRATTTRACVDIALGFAGPKHPEVDAARAQVFRFAQRLALVTAGVANDATQAAFCADAELVPTDAYDRIVAIRPDLSALIERACAESLGDSDEQR